MSDGNAISYPADSPQEIIDQIIASNEERIAAARKAKEEKQPEFIEKQLAKLKIEKVESGEEFEL